MTVIDPNLLSASFEENRAHLRVVAFHLLGSLSEAEDAVQETWLRLSRADHAAIVNLRGWLTTVVAHVCLDLRRARMARREDASGMHLPDVASHTDAEQEAVLADSIGLALLVVLETLDPAERLAFVLHDVFGVSFDAIAPLVGRSPLAARKLASRARRRVRGSSEADDVELARQRKVIDALLIALREEDVAGVVAALAPDVVVRVDGGGGPREIHGASVWAKQAVAYTRATRGAQSARVALIDGTVGAILAPAGRLASALRFAFAGAKISRVEIISDAVRLRALAIAVIDDDQPPRGEGARAES